MKLSITHDFLGCGAWASTCNIHINSKDGINYILFEDLNEGISVTNASEQLAENAISIFDLHPKDCRFFEIYSKNFKMFDEIEYTWKEIECKDYKDMSYFVFNASNPKWIPAKKEVKQLFIDMIK